MRTDKKHKNTDKKIKFNTILINLGCYYILSSSSIFVQYRKTQTLEIYYIQQQGRLLLEVLYIYITLVVASTNLYLTDPSNTRATHHLDSLDILFLSLRGPTASPHTENIS